MRNPIVKAILFVAVAVALLIATGPLVALVAAIMGTSYVPVWLYAAGFSVLLLAATAVALRWDGTGLESLGLTVSSRRVREFTFGFLVGGILFSELALVRGATVDATWSFGGVNAIFAACTGLLTAFVMLLPEELLFRGYAFQRLVQTVGAWPGILISAVLFGLYHLVGSGMWGMGGFFRLAMPTLGGVVFGWAALRTRGLALPIGLHLAGNWVPASVFSFERQSDVGPVALWTSHVTDIQQRFLYAPDLAAHLPFIVTMLVAAVAVHLAFQTQERTA